MKRYKASCPTLWGHHIHGEWASTKVLAVVTLNKVARRTGNRIDFTKLVVKTS